MSVLDKIYRLVIYGFMYDSRVVLSYIFSYVGGTKATKLSILNVHDLSKLLRDGQSLIRIGDGEAMLMTGRDIHYQKSSLQLKRDLRNIVDTYNIENNFILCVPVDALQQSSQILKEKRRYRIWRLFRCFCRIRLNKNTTYADAHVFYDKKYLNTVLPTILMDRHIICVTRKENIDEGLKNYISTYSPLATYIETPSSNTYEVREELERRISDSLSNNSDRTPLILLAAGPASKVLAYNFITKSKIQCIDIGHGIEIIGKDKDYKNFI